MSGSTNNFSPTQGNRRAGQGYGAQGPSNNDWNRVHPLFSRPPVTRNPWLPPIQERITRGPVGLASFPLPPLSPMEFRVLDEMSRVMNGRPRQFIPESPPRFIEQQWRNTQVPTQEEHSRLTQDEQKKAMTMLKKEIYNPTPKNTAKGIAKRLNLYYRDNANARGSFDEMAKEEDEDGKRCAICLDDFEPRQLVMLTPCNHMFHEECIEPWVKSHGQCPVCRFAICERLRENAMPLNSNTARIPASGVFARDAMSILRDMDEGFDWGEFIIF